MHLSGFQSAPVTQVLVSGVVIASILASVTDTKFYFPVVPHLWEWGQWWRILTWQTCYANSTEVLFSALALYHLRVVERIWGSRKFASFIVVSLLYSLVITPSLTGLLRLLGLAKHTYVPAGPTPLLFAILAQYHAAVPYLYRFNVGALSGSEANSHSGTIALTSKSTSYILPLQLALSQFPYALAPALVGWIVGYGYRWELLPGSLWRVPGLVVGQSTRLGMSTAESRRVLDETSARSSGADAGHAAAVRRGGLSR